MTHLPSCTARNVDRALRKRGFVIAHQKGSHRYYADPVTRDVITTVPMHPGDVPRWLLKKIIKDAGLTEDEFRELMGADP
jgi:predicted RNA binding protein YcfA (HicA-like mRNA interferase family)